MFIINNMTACRGLLPLQCMINSNILGDAKSSWCWNTHIHANKMPLNYFTTLHSSTCLFLYNNHSQTASFETMFYVTNLQISLQYILNFTKYSQVTEISHGQWGGRDQGFLIHGTSITFLIMSFNYQYSCKKKCCMM